MKKKEIVFVCGMILLSLGMAACGAKKSEEQHADSSAEQSEEHPADSAEEHKKILLQSADIDLEKIRKAVFPQDNSPGTLDTSYDEVTFFTTEQGLSLNADAYSVHGSTRQWDTYNDFIHFRSADGAAMQTPVDVELEFLSREEVKERANVLVGELGIPFEICEINVEAYTAGYLTELVRFLKEDSIYRDFVKTESLEKAFSSADEMYYVEIGFQENGLPISREDIPLLDETMLHGMEMSFYLMEDGIQDFAVRGWKEKAGKEETIRVCTEEEGLETIAGKYRNIVTEEEIEILDAELVYLMMPSGMQGDLYLTPVLKFNTRSSVWMNSSQSGQAEEIIVEDVILVHGETGRIIE